MDYQNQAKENFQQYPVAVHAPGYYPVPQQNYPPGPGLYPPLQQDIPIINQPVSNNSAPNDGWMAIPQHINNCPPGLEYLTMIDQLLVHQKVELLEAITGFETENKYSIKNNLGQKVYYAGEDSDCCSRNCCGPIRPFEMRIFDNFGNHVIHLNRPLACDTCWFPCCLQTIEVSAPPGTLIGTVEQNWSVFCPKFAVKNAAGEVILRIEGPFCTMSCCCCCDVEFQVLTSDGKMQVGKITKQWSGLAKEIFTDADNFGLTFPMDLDVRMKAVMIGACFLIDFMFFETTREKGDKPGMWH
ncbi:hypothetical protein ILUMI_24663 [Ignelater luminosus]|uniref:Phospholipid scramblase n=1 Tax=Ignelater luminosus TaxID=2038154 RepID=A0A8K0G0F0_IGNLU|nr:hypothetical protein ILUMI_24663 [Ignelater luminosus]